MAIRPQHLAPFVLVASLALGGTTNGCGSGEGPVPDGFVRRDPNQLTVSYRNKVRLPEESRALLAQDFATQIRKIDPATSVHCLAEESPTYKDAATFLGGVHWSHPLSIIHDSSIPPLFAGPQPESRGSSSGDAEAASGSASAGAPVIERPDLVGVQDGIAMFLSKQHGLLAVDARTGDPKLSCSMKLPGDPMNFLFKGNELVIVVNSRGAQNRSALMRYSFDGARFHFVEALRFQDQRILDARLFDSTIVAYTSWSKPLPAGQAAKDPLPWAEPTGMGLGASYGGRYGGASMSESAAPSGSSYGGYATLGQKVIVAKWDDKLDVDFEDSLLNDPQKQDPTEGLPPQTEYTVGQIVNESKSYKPFVTASDRYLVVPRDVVKTRFTGYETYNYTVCTSWNPRAYEVDSCNTTYEQRPNPDYKAPSPTTGDYSCNGKTLADCIKEAAPVVSQYIYVPTGTTCQKVWQGACEKYEPRSQTYPRFEYDKETQMMVYRFEAGSFVRLDSQMATLEEKTDAIAFKTSPLSVKGSVANKNQIQFQNGHLYVFSDQALQTLAVAGNSISYLNRLPIAASTEMNPSVVFSNDRAMISARNTYDYQSSSVAMLDLSTPSKPKSLTSFDMPGQSTQLILADGGILGPGQVQFGGWPQVSRNLQKLTLFSRDAGNELDNLLLGTEYDSLESSWFYGADDQRIRLAGSRLFLPYSGRHHADQYEPYAHRLSISRIDGGRLVSERSFQVSEEIIRTAGLDANRSLVFANSAAYVVDHSNPAPAAWTLGILRELFVPFATYRLDDKDLYARIARVGSKCRITTHVGHSKMFVDNPLAEATIPCGEGELPTGYGRSVLFNQTATGVEISEDGTSITPVAKDAVIALFKTLSKGLGYCFIEGGATYAPVLYLDDAPKGVICKAPTAD